MTLRGIAVPALKLTGACKDPPVDKVIDWRYN